MNSTSRLFAWCFVGTVGVLLGAYLLMAASGRHDDDKDFHLQQFGQLPILDHGRVKPMDTLARISLMILSGKQEYKDINGVTQPATRWLLNVMTARLRRDEGGVTPVSGKSRLVKAYRIKDPRLRKMLKLEADSDALLSLEDIYLAAGAKGIEELRAEVKQIQKQHQDASNLEHLLASLTAEERAVVDLFVQIEGHLRYSEIETSDEVFRIENQDVLALLGLEARPGFRYSFGEFLPHLGVLERENTRAENIKPRDRTLFDHKALDLGNHVTLYRGLALGNAQTLHLIAPSEKDGPFLMYQEEAPKAYEALKSRNPDEIEAHSSGLSVLSLLHTYVRNDKPAFNEAVERYLKATKKVIPRDMSKVTTESSFNSFAPFFVCMVFYVVLFVVVSISWVWPEPVIRRFAFWATILTVCIHTWALGLRMYIQGRPPVTNLYSSAVFIGWACVLVTLIVERIFRNGIAMAVGIITGGLTLIIAHHLGGSGDTLEMMQAVLDTNFWLATHVTAVTIGYSATFVAGFFGLVTVLMVVGVTVLRALGHRVELNYAMMKLLGQCIYGVVCFAMLFSFLGTVLGGIWADASWGRFWGWDPKENGALLIVIMNAMILHARWGGMIKERGLATLAMVGNMVTMWSWFGTNQLGIGLHAYGFNNTLVLLCRYFWLSQLLLIGVALIPFKAWSPTFMPLVRTKEPKAPTATPKKARPGRGQILPGGAS